MSTERVKLSVIVPAYNMEDTLPTTIESILSQGVEGMEIIIIDDGSTDHTGSVAETLRKAHSEIKVVHQANEGLSVARNSGIEAAEGDLITFVDSDDWVAAGTYPKLLELFDDYPESDILEYPLTHFTSNEPDPITTFPTGTYTKSYDYWFIARGYEHCYAWNKIFRRHVFFPIQGVAPRFEVGRTFEDTAFFAELLLSEPIITIVDQGCYIYCQNPRGITSQATATDISQLLDVHLRAINRLLAPTEKGQRPRRKLTQAEEDYYMAVVNIQITLCRLSSQAPKLPSRKVSISKEDFLHFPIITKKLLLNLFGIKTLCRLFKLVHTS